MKEKYAVIGFSTGAHLASEIETSNCGYKPAREPKPGAIILGYPLVTFEGRGLIMRTCIANFLLGKSPDPGKKRASFVPDHMDADYPAVYMLQGLDVSILPCKKNSMVLARRAQDLGVPYKLNLVIHAEHGIGLALGVEARNWFDESIAFWNSHGNA
nr:hypothetical protein [Candidatus Sigynarchaeota archaeon]